MLPDKLFLENKIINLIFVSFQTIRNEVLSQSSTESYGRPSTGSPFGTLKKSEKWKKQQQQQQQQQQQIEATTIRKISRPEVEVVIEEK